MKFKRILRKTHDQLEVGDIFVHDSLVHWWKIVKVATPSNKTEYLAKTFYLHGFKKITLGLDYEDITMSELLDLQPHLTRALLVDMKISINEEVLKTMPTMVCFGCCNHAFSGSNVDEDLDSKTLGTCYSCGKEKQRLYRSDDFKLNIFR